MIARDDSTTPILVTVRWSGKNAPDPRLDAIGAARTEDEFVAAWRAWYFDDDNEEAGR